MHPAVSMHSNTFGMKNKKLEYLKNTPVVIYSTSGNPLDKQGVKTFQNIVVFCVMNI